MKKILFVKWIVQATETPRIRTVVAELAEKTRAETGNVFFDIYQSEIDPNTFILHECFADSAAAEAHRQSEHYQRIVVKQIIPHLAAREVIAVQRVL